MTAEIDFILRSLVARVAAVRRWLVTLAVLKVISLALLFSGLYIAAYAWLDHRFHLGVAGRAVALGLLVAGLVWLLYRLARSLIGHVSCHNAANYIESKHSFDQQLVTAIEYHENKNEYPYSKPLADYLVSQVDGASKTVPFDITVPKWQAYMLLAVTLLGFIGAGFFLYNNYAFFSRYFARLTQPTAAIAPLPPTQLVAVTKDIIVEPNTTIELVAEIRGELPDEGRLVIVYRDANEVADATSEGPIAPIDMWPIVEENKQPRLQKQLALPAGRYRYRFEAARSVTEWHDIRICPMPQIESITAKITPHARRAAKPYTEEVDDFSLEVPENSRITLTIKTSQPLAQAQITTPDGKSLSKEMNSQDEFTVDFVADEDGFVQFELLSSDQVANKQVPPFQVRLRADKPAKFSLLSPGGDYLATNVASVPVAFEISDDFGLEWAALYWEVAGSEPEVINAAVELGSRKVMVEKTFELEDYDLEVGDTIMVYARAQDVNVSGRGEGGAMTSDIYFVEIKPYRQLWLQSKSGLPGQAKQGLTGEMA